MHNLFLSLPQTIQPQKMTSTLISLITRGLAYCFFQIIPFLAQIPSSTFINLLQNWILLSDFAPCPRLFSPPRLFILQLLYPSLFIPSSSALLDTNSS